MTETMQRVAVRTSSVRRDLVLDGATLALLGMIGLTGSLGHAAHPVPIPVYLGVVSLLVPWAVRWEGLTLSWPVVTATKTVLLLPLVAGLGRRAVGLSPSLVIDFDPFHRSGSSPQLALLSLALVLALQPRGEEAGTHLDAVWRWAGVTVLTLGALLVPGLDVLRAGNGTGSLDVALDLAVLLSVGLPVAMLVALVASGRPAADLVVLVGGVLALVFLVAHDSAVSDTLTTTDGFVTEHDTGAVAPVPGATAAAGLVLAAGCLWARRRARPDRAAARSATWAARALPGIAVLLASTSAALLSTLLMVAAAGDWQGGGQGVLVQAGGSTSALLAALVLARRADTSRVTAVAAAVLVCTPLALQTRAALGGPDHWLAALLGRPFDDALQLAAATTAVGCLLLSASARKRPLEGASAPTRG